MRVLLIEDDAALAADLTAAMQASGWEVDWSDRGERLVNMLRATRYDVALLDIGLPGIDGFEALAQARTQHASTPVMMLTARDAVSDRVHGLETGADDYLVKPFALDELLARVRALARRNAQAGDHVLVHGPLRLNCGSKRAYLGDQILELSPREWTVLEMLATNAERVVDKDAILRVLAIDGGELSINAVEVYVFRLRAKLEPSGVRIRTVRGFGYLLEPYEQ